MTDHTASADRSAPERALRIAGLASCAAICLFVLWTTGLGRFPTHIQNGVVLALAMSAVLLLTPGPLARGGRVGTADALLTLAIVAAGAWACVYYMREYHAIASMRSGLPNRTDIVCYAVGIAVVLEAGRRAEGWLFLSVVLAFVLYMLFGQHLPGIVGHRGLFLDEILENSFGPQGVFGVAFTSVVEVVYVFIVLGVVLRVTGIGEFFNFVAEKLTRGRRSGPAQCAVVASALFGSINGSAPANVASTGVLTIPMMKRAGYPAAFAGGVEASASCVGQLLPPVMGVGAFIMSEVTGIPYVQIMLVALVPALLFIGSIGVAAAFEARRLGLRPLPDVGREEWTRLRVGQGAALVASFAVLLAMLFSGFSATYSGLAAIGAALAVAAAVPELRPGPRQIGLIVVDGGRDGIKLAAACAAIGIIIAAVASTGVGIKINQTITVLGGESLILALVLAAACSVVIGMGLPTAASYLMVVFIAGPAIMRLGVPEIQAHMFVFYYAVLSAITPPVALAVFAAAAIAGAPQMAVAMKTLRLAMVGFVLPIAWIYHPELMLAELSLATLPYTLFVISAFVVAIVAASAAFAGVALTPLHPAERALLTAAAVLVVWPGAMATLAGVGLAALGFARQFRAGAGAAREATG
jgi:TRAP transporter 4TM/12TM fusion protein